MERSTQSPLLNSARHLEWLPDETVYSLASRHHRLSGNVREEQTARQLFGHARGGYPHDLPAGLDYFADALGLRLGNGADIALERTLLPMLLTFRGLLDRNDAIAAMRSLRLGPLKARLGLLASGFGAMALLKACPACMPLDEALHGTSYWHVQHQLPGVWFCPSHGELLQFSGSKRAGQFRFEWILPHQAELRPCFATATEPRASILAFMSRLSAMIVAANAHSRATAVDHGEYSRAIWSKLVAEGSASRNGRLRVEEICRQVNALFQNLSALPDWTAGSPNESAAYSYVQRVVHQPDRGHSLHPLTLIAWLFESWDEFIDRSRPLISVRQPDVKSAESDTTLEVRSQLLQCVFDQGHSISSAANSLGVAISTAQGWVTSEGFEIPKRPSKLKEQKFKQVVAQLEAGADIRDIAADAGISEVSVRRAMRTNVGLRAAWIQARLEKSRAAARLQWQSALQLEVAVGPGSARALEPKAYSWLYRNDRKWLLETNFEARAPNGGNYANVDWDSRDHDLSVACSRAALQLHDKSPNMRVTLTQVFKLVPEMRTKMCHLDRLPLTARALRSIVRGRG